MAICIQGDSLWEDRFSGTPDYASYNTLRGGKCGAKDDCESLCYSLLEMWNGMTSEPLLALVCYLVGLARLCESCSRQYHSLAKHASELR